MRTMLMTAAVAVMLGQGTARPGDIPRPDVWIKNDRNEPIPVDLRAVNLDSPIRVRVINGDAGDQPLRVRVIPPTWEYMTATVGPAADPARTVQSLGANGWEVAGLLPRGQDTVVLLKRPR